jgi:AhpD family alkylhydroperoxidase
MATVKHWTDEDVNQDARVKAVFDDIRRVRKSDFVNNFWRGLCNQPALLERTWANLKEVMVKEGALDPLTKEMIYMAVSTVNGCSYCVHSHTAAARAKGMSPAQHEEFLAALQIPVDKEFLV